MADIATLEEVKEALRVDYDDEDIFLEMCMNSAYEYLYDSIDDFETKVEITRFARKAKLPYILITQELFDNRSYSTKDNEKIKHIVQSMLLQMNFSTYEEEEEDA